jgi:hypothetical protein
VFRREELEAPEALGRVCGCDVNMHVGGALFRQYRTVQEIA